MTQRTALVTGGTGGIGTAICCRLAEMGHRVVTSYRNPEKAQAWKDLMAEKNYEAVAIPGDISDPQSAREVVEAAERGFGPVDILVNNAGITRDSTFHKMSPEDWQSVINTNLNGVYNVTRPVIEHMRGRQWGRIIQIASINGQKGQYGQANYAAAKAGMHGFTISLALENARHGITVNTVSPGYVATDMVMSVPETVREKIIDQIPVGRLGTPEEIAYAVSFFVAEEAGWVTGATLAVNGGHYMGW